MESHDQNEITQLIINAVTSVLEQDEDAPKNLSADTELVGEDSILDSIGVIELVTSLEEAIEEKHGIVISLFDDEVLFDAEGPFNRISKLARHITEVLESESANGDC